LHGSFEEVGAQTITGGKKKCVMYNDQKIINNCVGRVDVYYSLRQRNIHRQPHMVSKETGLRQKIDEQEEEKHEQLPEYHTPLTMDSVPLSTEIDDVSGRSGPYLPSCYRVYDKIKGSIHLAFLSHSCFILASAFYLKLALITLNWYLYTRRLGVPEEVLDEDTEEVWKSWTFTSGEDYMLDEWKAYRVEYEFFYIMGALFFVFVGFLDLFRYFDCLNMVLVFAGVAGMISALSTSYYASTAWDFVSVHMFLIEAINLLHRKHNYEGLACFRIGDFSFLFGASLDCIGSYVGIAKQEGLWVIQMDVFACCLWLLSSLTDITAEIYYLRKHWNADGRTIHCY